MPEGNVIHRLARALTELYAGQRLEASSPQGRFAAGAERLSGQVLLPATAHGKHLFVPFAPEADVPLDDPVVAWLHIHLGLYGSWTFDGDATFTAPHAIGAPRRRLGEGGEVELPALTPEDMVEAGIDDTLGQGSHDWTPPAPRGAVRLRLEGEHGIADLTGPTRCEVLDGEGVAAVRRRLGPDPLRADADPQAFIDAVRSRRKSVGELLMDQSVIAGVGNIYRAETLLRCGVSPFRAGNRTSAARLQAIWDDLVPLMTAGIDTGAIITVDPADVPNPLPENDAEARRWYVYHRTGRPCLKCGAIVREQEMVGRRLFWCPDCQAR